MAKGENVFHRKDGRYEARYVKGRKEDGKLIYGFCYGRTYEEARNKAIRARNELAGTVSPEEDSQNNLSYFCDSWMTTNNVRLKASSRAKYSAVIMKHIKPFFGDRFPGEIKSEDIDAFTRMLLHEKNLSIKTVRNILTLLHSILIYTGRRSGTNLQNLEIIYPKAHKKDARVLDEKEEHALIRILERNMDFCGFGIYLALRTGMRIGEICALRWSDVSFETFTISIRHTAQRLPRKDGCHKTKRSENNSGTTNLGNDGNGLARSARTALVLGPAKSESSLRTIPLMPDIAALCQRFSSSSPEMFLLTGTDKCMDPRKLQRRLAKHLSECGIKEAHFHTLRHTFATRCIEAGFDVKTLSEILGHSNIGITLNLYVHPNLDLKRENMSRLGTGICI